MRSYGIATARSELQAHPQAIVIRCPAAVAIRGVEQVDQLAIEIHLQVHGHAIVVQRLQQALMAGKHLVRWRYARDGPS
ncbi:hypothetical protein XcuCFBP2542_15130 [Xanthomonas cucurbitae]|uniref:Uncharacterized protein n=1 Tax=Xanthomonas cucurbitae TaxID=56453 RepID=A0A2S7DN37_9XANT|nr:hypothetical protein XcuCFBP2542_15130 [Xanthomonas cucurbitae]